ncbi:MAG: UMP kinase [Oscillospiraceae bacterium]|nr:UMP kinase [Oscillospiraceae bacterium]
MSVKYKRVLLKISGEALAGEKGFGIDFDTVDRICRSIKDAYDEGVQLAIVVGGGNYWRGGRSSGDMERTRADKIGMLATIMNALTVASGLEKLGCEATVMSALQMNQVAEPFIRDNAVKYLEEGRIVIFGCGTGNPFFSTDSGAVLRALEINADIVFKATMVDGVYDKDPKKYPDAVKYDTLTFTKVFNDQLNVMDMTAATMCRDNHMSMLVFEMSGDNIKRAVLGENIGTVVSE